MGYLFLALTILSESAAVILMKLSNGFQHKIYAVIAIAAYILSFVFLTFSLKQLPAGPANAIWAGASTILVAVLGVLVFKEQVNFIQVIFFALIVIGIIGLHLTASS